jgi:hypothetical protein
LEFQDGKISASDSAWTLALGSNALTEDYRMSFAVKTLLNSFETLSESDKHEAAVEILKRSAAVASGDLPDEALIEMADELFQALDANESGHAKP